MCGFLLVGGLALAACTKPEPTTEPVKVGLQPQQPPQPPPQPPEKNPKKGGGLDVTKLPLDRVGGMFGGGTVSKDKEPALKAKYTAALVGTWEADLGNGVTEELTYKADNSYMAARKGPEPKNTSGTYSVTGLAGSKSLKIELKSATGSRTVTATFEGDELLHPTFEPGLTGVFRKKK
jgi:hypothetical protein